MSRYLITGAAGGLGAHLCERLRKAGAQVVPMVRSEASVLDCPGAMVMDFAGASPSRISEAILKRVTQEFGVDDPCPFDGIVHCAGAEVVHPLRRHQDPQYLRATAAADGAFGILMAAADGAVIKGGSIVMMSSVAAHRGVAGMVAYCAGKAAIEGMVRAGAMELARKRIRVNAVAAGAFRTPMHDRITRGLTDDGQAAYAGKHPLGIGALEHVGDVVLQLLQGSWWQTGSTVVVDGGYLAG
jgi:NAD(P)-dependent dehydrogenase (short-subunit alcohol dehydrogenase family)